MSVVDPGTELKSLGLGAASACVSASLSDAGRLVNETSQIPDLTHYVYVVSLRDGSLGRAAGRSSVLYVGKGTDGRAGELLAGTHSACRALSRLHHVLSRGGAGVPVSLSLFAQQTDDLAILHEVLALNRIALKHGELPPANLRWEQWLSDRVLAHVGGRAVAGRARWRCSAPYDWPRARPVATLVDLHKLPKSGVQRMSWSNHRCALGWVWGAAWQPDEECPSPGSLFVLARKEVGPAVTGASSLRGALGGAGDWDDERIVALRSANWLLSKPTTSVDLESRLTTLLSMPRLGGKEPPEWLREVVQSLESD